MATTAGERVKREGWKRALSFAQQLGYTGEEARKRARSMWYSFCDQVSEEAILGGVEVEGAAEEEGR